MTHACNLACKYCFHSLYKEGNVGEEKAGASGLKNSVMDFDVARKAIGMMPKGETLRVGFFGGEPLIAMEEIKEIVEYVKGLAELREVGRRFSLTTNGTLIDEEVTQFLAKNKFSLIISVDGEENLHNASRPKKNGGGSYEEMLSALKLIAKYPILAKRTTLRGTYTAEDTKVLQRVKHLNLLAREYGLGNVSVEPADLSEGCAVSGARKVFIEGGLEEEYYRVAEWFASEIKKGRRPKFHHFKVRMDRLYFRIPQPSECGAGCGYITVNPDGEIYACHREGESCIGNVECGIDSSRQAMWCDNRYYKRKGCSECWLRNVCGGGCRLNSIHNNNDITEPDILGCQLTETCTKAAAWILSELSDLERKSFMESF
jgi:uncharacterized protein